MRYNFNIINNFNAKEVGMFSENVRYAILQETLSQSLENIVIAGNTISIDFDGELTSGEQTQIENIINNTTEIPIPAVVAENSSNLRSLTKNIQFTHIGQLNYEEYLYAGIQVSTSGNTKRSGSNNGFRWNNSAPHIASFTGYVNTIAMNIVGLGVNGNINSAPNIIPVTFELWKIGTDGSEGTKLGDASLDVDKTLYTIGSWGDSSVLTQFQDNKVNIPFDQIQFNKGDLLGLKWNPSNTNGQMRAFNNAVIDMELVSTEQF